MLSSPSGQLIPLLCYLLIKKIRADFQLLFHFQSTFIVLVLKRIFQLTKSSIGKEDAKKTVKMQRKNNTGRKVTKRKRKSTELRKEKRNYSPN